jgi:hypothetical protein
MSGFGSSKLLQRSLFGDTGNLCEAAIQRATTARRAAMFKGTFTLCLVSQNHFANGIATADGRIDEAHDFSPFVCTEYRQQVKNFLDHSRVLCVLPFRNILVVQQQAHHPEKTLRNRARQR